MGILDRLLGRKSSDPIKKYTDHSHVTEFLAALADPAALEEAAAATKKQLAELQGVQNEAIEVLGKLNRGEQLKGKQRTSGMSIGNFTVKLTEYIKRPDGASQSTTEFFIDMESFNSQYEMTNHRRFIGNTIKRALAQYTGWSADIMGDGAIHIYQPNPSTEVKLKNGQTNSITFKKLEEILSAKADRYPTQESIQVSLLANELSRKLVAHNIPNRVSIAKAHELDGANAGDIVITCENITQAQARKMNEDLLGRLSNNKPIGGAQRLHGDLAQRFKAETNSYTLKIIIKNSDDAQQMLKNLEVAEQEDRHTQFNIGGYQVSVLPQADGKTFHLNIDPISGEANPKDIILLQRVIHDKLQEENEILKTDPRAGQTIITAPDNDKEHLKNLTLAMAALESQYQNLQSLQNARESNPAPTTQAEATPKQSFTKKVSIPPQSNIGQLVAFVADERTKEKIERILAKDQPNDVAAAEIQSWLVSSIEKMVEAAAQQRPPSK